MGQAKRRGTFEQRKEAAIEKAKNTPQPPKRVRRNHMADMLLASVLGDAYGTLLARRMKP